MRGGRKRCLFGVQNSRKARDGMLAGLLDPAFVGRERAEAEFKSRLAGRSEFAGCPRRLRQDCRIREGRSPAQMVSAALLEGGQAFIATAFQLRERCCARATSGRNPTASACEEFSDANQESLELDLFSEKPIYNDLEILTLTDSLTFLATELDADDPTRANKCWPVNRPSDRAAQLIEGTKVRDVAFRKKLYEGGAAAVSAADDPMIDLARLVDGKARAVAQSAEAQGEIRKQAQAAHFARPQRVARHGGLSRCHVYACASPLAR